MLPLLLYLQDNHHVYDHDYHYNDHHVRNPLVLQPGGLRRLADKSLSLLKFTLLVDEGRKVARDFSNYQRTKGRLYSARVCLCRRVEGTESPEPTFAGGYSSGGQRGLLLARVYLCWRFKGTESPELFFAG